MPPKTKVELNDAVMAICKFGNYLITGLPNYNSPFYEDVSMQLNKNWSRNEVYINLKTNRRNLTSLVYQQLGIFVNDQI